MPFTVTVKRCLAALSDPWNHLGALKTIDAWVPPPDILI